MIEHEKNFQKANPQLDRLELTDFIQTLRQQNPYPGDSPEYLLWDEQCEVNLPFLIHASFYLDGFCKKRNTKRILFTSRDCCLWIQLFQALYPNYESIYFHASRYIYENPSDSYIEYVRNLYVGDVLIVDIHASGRSCIKFFKKNFRVHPNWLSIVNTGNRCHGIVRKDGQGYRHVEMLNYDVVGALYDMQDAQPLRAPPEYNIRYVHPSHACIRKCVEMLPHFQVGSFQKQIIEQVLRRSNDNLQVYRYLRHAMFHRHHRISNTENIWKHFYIPWFGGLFEVGVKLPWENA